MAKSSSGMSVIIQRVEPSRGTSEIAFRDVGPVSEATVKLRPLTLFVGENNSGKSWLCSLIWGLHQGVNSGFRKPGHPAWEAAVLAVADVFTKAPLTSARQRSIDNWLDKSGGGLAPRSIERLSTQWREWAKALTDEGSAEIVKQITPHAGKASRVEMPPREGQVVAWRQGKSRGSEIVFTWFASEAIGDHIDGSFAVGFGHRESEDPAHLYEEIARDLLAWFAGWPAAPGGKSAGHLPASRSSFVQLLPILTQHSFARAWRRRDDTAEDFFLPRQQQWFAEALLERSSRSDGSGKFLEISKFIEEHILHGTVHPDKLSPTAFEFRPAGVETTIPMTSTSSVVTELAPLVHILRTNKLPLFIVIEEPEAHLHPKLQRLLAKVIVRLVRAGIRLLVTTHSDIFAQQINNALKLGYAQDQLSKAAFDKLLRKLGAAPNDTIQKTEISAYEFARRADGKTDVRQLSIGDDGIVMPSFNIELQALNDEMDTIEEARSSNVAR